MSQVPASSADSQSRENVSLRVLPQRAFGQTSRTGAWWITPVLVVLGLGSFIVYFDVGGRFRGRTIG